MNPIPILMVAALACGISFMTTTAADREEFGGGFFRKVNPYLWAATLFMWAVFILPEAVKWWRAHH